MNNQKRNITIISVMMMCFLVLVVFLLTDDKELQKDVVEKVTDVVTDMTTYEMSAEEIENLPTTEIIEQTAEEEKQVEQEVEDEAFELQGEIAYEGDRANTWNVELGDYKGLTYYSQIDSRWRYNMYSSIGDSSQNIGTSGCGPTSAAMIVTAIKGTITPDTMANLFVQYGYRSSNSGTYWSAFRAIADEFNIEYQESSNIETVLDKLRNNHYVVASVGNGLFTNGGHFIVLVGIDGDNLKIYDPYLYSGKFDTSTRRGKVYVEGNTVYCPINNFKEYANAKGYFIYKNEGNTEENNSKPVTTEGYTRYVSASALNVRSGPGMNYNIIGTKYYGNAVKVYETSGIWAKISDVEWVSTNYLVEYVPESTIKNTVGNLYRFKNKTYIYSKSNLTGTKYSYLAQTQVRVLQNISDTVDYVEAVKTGRRGYVNVNAYTNTSASSKSTVGEYKRLKNKTTLYSKSNLTGTKYSYLPNTQVKILQNVSGNVDYVQATKTGRKAYLNTNSYK